MKLWKHMLPGKWRSTLETNNFIRCKIKNHKKISMFKLSLNIILHSLCPKNIVRFLESWKMTNFETPYINNERRDWPQISGRSSFWLKLQWCEIWVTSGHSILRYEASKLGIFKISINRTIFLGQREYCFMFQREGSHFKWDWRNIASFS